MKLVSTKFLISLCLLVTIFSCFYINNSHIVRKDKSCKPNKSEVAEIIIIKKDKNGETISRERTTYPQRITKENEGNLISSIEDWKHKLGSIKKIKQMPAKVLKVNLTNLLKDKLPKKMPAKILKTNLVNLLKDKLPKKNSNDEKKLNAAKVVIAEEKKIEQGKVKIDNDKKAKSAKIIFKEEKIIEKGKKKIDKSIKSIEKKDTKMENSMIKIDNLKKLINEPKEKAKIKILVKKISKNNAKLEKKVTTKIPKIIENMQKATAKIEENNEIKNMKPNEQKEVVNTFKYTFDEGSNFIKIGNKEVTESTELMEKGLADSGFKMLNMGHQNIKKGMKIIRDGRNKLNAVTKKLDEVDKGINTSVDTIIVKAAEESTSTKKIKQKKVHKKPEVKSIVNSVKPVGAVLPIAAVVKKEVKKKVVKPRKFNPILAMIKKAEDKKSKKTKK